MARYKNTQIHASPVAEGVRFEIGSATAFAVRNEAKDIGVRIRREKHPLRKVMEKIPFLRGMLRLILTVVRFLDGIFESAELDPQKIARGTRFEKRFAELFRIHPANFIAFGSTLLMPILLIGLMLGLPMATEKLILSQWELAGTAITVIVCIVRLIGTLAALYLISHLRVINRLCMYRGAINKVLNAYSQDSRRMTHESVVLAPRIARKSNAAFVTMVILLSIIAFACIRIYTLPAQILIRILIILAIAGIINEPIQWLENLSPDHPFALLLAPQMWLERMFVIEPHSQMVEVAICAFNAASENDSSKRSSYY